VRHEALRRELVAAVDLVFASGVEEVDQRRLRRTRRPLEVDRDRVLLVLEEERRRGREAGDRLRHDLGKAFADDAILRRDGLSGQLASRGKQDVMAAALRVEGAVQLRLWKLGGPGATTGLREARYLHDLQQAAHAAIVAVTGQRKEAKAIQRKAAGERDALTVCVGKKLRRLPDDVLAKHAPDLLEHYGENIVPLGHGDGCGVIILDSLLERRPKMYCEPCRKQTGNTMNSGKAKNARHRLIDARKRPSRKRFG